MYKTLVADPPWQYNNKRTGGFLKGKRRLNCHILNMK